MSTSAPDPVLDDATASRKKRLLRVHALSAFYGELEAIHDVSFTLSQGEALAVIGANGAGKSTLLRSIAGLMNAGGSTRIEGTIQFDGQETGGWPPDQVVAHGITLVPEGRRLFARMSVEDNLLAGAYLKRCRRGIPAKIEEIYTLFPRLQERRRQAVSQMSGGEQQMVAIGRALMSSPKLLLLDELSLGLSPAMVEEIYRKLPGILGTGMTVILVEQDLKRALTAVDRFVVMSEGRLVLQGRPGEASEAAITAAYFGTARTPEAAGV